MAESFLGASVSANVSDRFQCGFSTWRDFWFQCRFQWVVSVSGFRVWFQGRCRDWFQGLFQCILTVGQASNVHSISGQWLLQS